MLQHVSLEVPPDEVERAVAFWELLGFAEVEPPEPLRVGFSWLERGPTQIHLIHTEAATVPALGHVAVVVDDFAATLERVAAAGHQVDEHRELWGRAPGVRGLSRRPPGGADGRRAAAGRGELIAPRSSGVRRAVA
ncbi:MAG: hypothetical protein GEU88_09355 [Solirubrobacterales bacterium]|nr:hypothetical protein [Solirubrobacterales bacterium]